MDDVPFMNILDRAVNDVYIIKNIAQFIKLLQVTIIPDHGMNVLAGDLFSVMMVCLIV